MIAYNEVNHYYSVVDIDKRQENFSTLMQPSSQGLTLPVRLLAHSASDAMPNSFFLYPATIPRQ
jgi:hypothetical protein